MSAPVDAVVHTPGPWAVKVFDDGAFMVSEGSSPDELKNMILASRNAAPGERRRESQANARLIAAAPELLDACKILLMLSLPTDISGERMVERARAAVAKAEGRSVV